MSESSTFQGDGIFPQAMIWLSYLGSEVAAGKSGATTKPDMA
jgi:hypothetical protein